MDPVAIRLIPAHAGKTRQVAHITFNPTAHPRSRGENDSLRVLAAYGDGSSPLTGVKPSCPVIFWGGGRAHPRSRGENEKSLPGDEIADGSSPLTRGKPRRAVPHRQPDGLIPAHAGKTAGSQTRASAWRAHPRSRGENGARGLPEWVLEGSSPLTRGKRGGGAPASQSTRLIPAHAGKTPGKPLCCACTWAHPRSRGENTS